MSVLKVTADFHLPLPKELLRALGVGVGDEVEVKLEEGRLVLRKHTASGVEALSRCASSCFEGYADVLDNDWDGYD